VNQYMVVIKLPSELTDEFIALIPGHRAQVNALMGRGIITSYALALDRSMIWTTIVAETAASVDEILETLPLREFIEPTVVPLAFSQNVSRLSQHVSLN